MSTKIDYPSILYKDKLLLYKKYFLVNESNWGIISGWQHHHENSKVQPWWVIVLPVQKETRRRFLRIQLDLLHRWRKRGSQIGGWKGVLLCQVWYEKEKQHCEDAHQEHEESWRMGKTGHPDPQLAWIQDEGEQKYHIQTNEGIF